MKQKEYIHDFWQYETIRFFGESSHTQKASIVDAEEDQNSLLKKYRRI